MNIIKITRQAIFYFASVLTLSACGVFTVHEHELQPGSADGVTFTVSGRKNYEQVWNAAIKAMSTDMRIVYSHKPSGTIKSRFGDEHTGKVVALFISPTTSFASQYRVELVSKVPLGLGQPERRNWEPSVVRDFESALAEE